MTPRDGGPAFPAVYLAHGGMSLRDYFAAKVAASIIATDSWEVESAGKAKRIEPKHVAKEAYLVADAMLAERKRST